jgi:hypothetical protein
MKKFIVFILIFIHAESYSQLTFIEKKHKLLTKIPTSEKSIDIPKYKNLTIKNIPFVYWHFCKQKEKQLSLSSPEQDMDSLLIRIWITNPIRKKGQPAGLIEIKKESTNWVGKLFLFEVNVDRKKVTETIINKKVIELEPAKSNWRNVIDSLFYYKIDSLPTDDFIPNYYLGFQEQYANNLQTYCFEISNKTSYRFYQYNNIYRAIDKFWQPKNVESILDILEREFKWDSIGRDYFKE